MVYALVLGTSEETRGGSSPLLRTKWPLFWGLFSLFLKFLAFDKLSGCDIICKSDTDRPFKNKHREILMNINYFEITMIAFAGSVFFFLLATLLNSEGKNLNQPIRWLGYLFYSLTPGSMVAAVIQRATLDQKLSSNTLFIATILFAVLIKKNLIVTEKENVVWGVVDGLFGGKSKSGGTRYMVLTNGTKILRPGESRERKIEFKNVKDTTKFELELATITYIITISYTYVPSDYGVFLPLAANDPDRNEIVKGNLSDMSKLQLNDILSNMATIDIAKEHVGKKKEALSELLLNAVAPLILKKCGVSLSVLLVSNADNTAEYAKAISQRNAAVQVREQALENLRAAGVINPTEKQLTDQMLLVANLTGTGDVKRIQYEVIGGDTGDIKTMKILAHDGHGEGGQT